MWAVIAGKVAGVYMALYAASFSPGIAVSKCTRHA